MRKIIKKIFVRLERCLGKFLTFHARPIMSDAVKSFNWSGVNRPRTAVILQGPLLLENDFTLETVKLYRKAFGYSSIVVSTWDDSDQSYLEKIRQAGAEVVLSEKPANSGISNINYQIVSTVSGLFRAKELGASYVLKSRTDQRIYFSGAIDLFLDALTAFPPSVGYQQKYRIAGLSLNTFKYRLYGLSDMCVFGQIDDMLLYWQAEQDSRSNEKMKNGLSQREYSVKNICEIYFATNFLRKLGREPIWTLSDSWSVFKDHFIVLDAASFDVYWPKYEHYKEFRHAGYVANSGEEMAFADWLNLYLNYDKMDILEDIINKSMNEHL